MIFDVYLLPKGTSEIAAKYDDLARATVEAEHSFGAGTSVDVDRLIQMGYYVADVVPHGSLSLLATRIRDRARILLDNSDRPDGYEDCNSAQRRRGVPYFGR
jgi:hypothetical protein